MTTLCNQQGRVPAYRCVLVAGHTGNHVMMVPEGHTSAPVKLKAPTKRASGAAKSQASTDPLTESRGKCAGGCGLACDGRCAA